MIGWLGGLPGEGPRACASVHAALVYPLQRSSVIKPRPLIGQVLVELGFDRTTRPFINFICTRVSRVLEFEFDFEMPVGR